MAVRGSSTVLSTWSQVQVGRARRRAGSHTGTRATGPAAVSDTPLLPGDARKEEEEEKEGPAERPSSHRSGFYCSSGTQRKKIL